MNWIVILVILTSGACNLDSKSNHFQNHHPVSEATADVEMVDVKRGVEKDKTVLSDHSNSEVYNTDLEGESVSLKPSPIIVPENTARVIKSEVVRTKVITSNAEDLRKPDNHKDTIRKRIIDNNIVADVVTTSDLLDVPERVSENTAKISEKKTVDYFVSHDSFDALLFQYVSNTGKVDYQGFKNDQEKLSKYLDLLKKGIPQNVSRNEQLAFWINAYNAFTIKLIIDHYPIESITDLYNGKPWDKKWISIGGKTLSLNNIENDIIRPQFEEPRIHFAVNCAAVSCPPLHNRAFTAANLEGALEILTKSFINNPEYNTITSNSIEISEIFNWYEADFGNVAEFINRYTDLSISNKVSIAYKAYNWDLNVKK